MWVKESTLGHRSHESEVSNNGRNTDDLEDFRLIDCAFRYREFHAREKREVVVLDAPDGSRLLGTDVSDILSASTTTAASYSLNVNICLPG